MLIASKKAYIFILLIFIFWLIVFFKPDAFWLLGFKNKWGLIWHHVLNVSLSDVKIQKKQWWVSYDYHQFTYVNEMDWGGVLSFIDHILGQLPHDGIMLGRWDMQIYNTKHKRCGFPFLHHSIDVIINKPQTSPQNPTVRKLSRHSHPKNQPIIVCGICLVRFDFEFNLYKLFVWHGIRSCGSSRRIMVGLIDVECFLWRQIHTYQ